MNGELSNSRPDFSEAAIASLASRRQLDGRRARLARELALATTRVPKPLALIARLTCELAETEQALRTSFPDDAR